MSFELPAGLAEPLHILEPTWQKAAAFVLLAASLAVTFWLLRRWRRRAAEIPPVAAPAPSPPSPAVRSGIAGAIDGLRETYLEGDRRRGCHELSELLRGHFAASGRRRRRDHRPFATLTAREVGRLLGEKRGRDFFYHLSNLQFRRQPPSPKEFGRTCDRAVELVQGKR